MKITAILLFSLFLINLNLNSNEKKEKDISAIKKMCGCFEVEFNFAETFIHTKDNNYVPSPVKKDYALEWVELLQETDDSLILQHILIVGEDEKRIVKHWRQDWLYENTRILIFEGDNEWQIKNLNPKEVVGQWTQAVYQVDDSPRYQGSATWVHIDGKSYWENISPAPLPRREWTIRDDYNVNLRKNRHEITQFGWVHDQDNKKIIRKRGQSDIVLSEEKGYNTYKKVDNAKCKLAQDWWAQNHNYWQKVREVWNEYYTNNNTLKLKKKVDDEMLFRYIFDLSVDAEHKQIREIIEKFKN